MLLPKISQLFFLLLKFRRKDIDGKPIEVSAGRGFVVSNDGIIVADGSLVPERSGLLC